MNRKLFFGTFLALAAFIIVLTPAFFVSAQTLPDPGIPDMDEMIWSGSNTNLPPPTNVNKNTKTTEVNAVAPQKSTAELPVHNTNIANTNESDGAAPPASGSTNTPSTTGGKTSIPWFNLAVIVGIVLSLALNALLFLRFSAKKRT